MIRKAFGTTKGKRTYNMLFGDGHMENYIFPAMNCAGHRARPELQVVVVVAILAAVEGRHPHAFMR